MSSQFLAPVLHEGEEDVERSLRPRRLDDFVGQERTKEQLSIALDAARARGDALDHVLLVGPPGQGKTTLATIVREGVATATSIPMGRERIASTPDIEIPSTSAAVKATAARMAVSNAGSIGRALLPGMATQIRASRAPA